LTHDESKGMATVEIIDAFVEINAREARRQHKRKIEEITECDESLEWYERKIRKLEDRKKWCQHQRQADKATECEESLERCKRKIQKLENSKGDLERKSAQYRLVSRLKKEDGAEAWEKLSLCDQWNKVNVLTVLRCCKFKDFASWFRPPTLTYVFANSKALPS